MSKRADQLTSRTASATSQRRSGGCCGRRRGFGCGCGCSTTSTGSWCPGGGRSCCGAGLSGVPRTTRPLAPRHKKGPGSG